MFIKYNFVADPVRLSHGVRLNYFSYLFIISKFNDD